MAVETVVWLAAHDYNRLRTLLADLARLSRGMQAGADTLEELLDLARIAEAVPADVVTMNSRVTYADVDTHEAGSVTIVYPEQADPANRKISVLSPLGAALLGETSGSEVELPLPHGRTRRVRIENVQHQAEDQGEYAF